MDWNLTATTKWDLTHLEQEAFTSVNTGGGSSGGGDFSVDLKLGQVVNGGNEYGGKWKEWGEGKSSKRAKSGSNGNLPAACLVDGCRSDLNNCRNEHRRHKSVSSTPKLPRSPLEAKNKGLEEFDEWEEKLQKMD